MSQINPKEFYENYQSDKLSKGTFIKGILDIIELSSNEQYRLLSLDILSKLIKGKQINERSKISQFFKDLVLSDEDDKIRANSLEILLIYFFNESQELIDWVLKRGEDYFQSLIRLYDVLRVRKKDQKAMDILDKMNKRFGYEFQAKYNLQSQDAVGLGLLKEFIGGEFLISMEFRDRDHEFYVGFEIKDRHINYIYNRNFYIPTMEIFELFPNLVMLCIYGMDAYLEVYDITHLKSLKFLRFDDGLVSLDQIEGLSEMTNLKVLEIYNGGLMEIGNLTGLRNLEELVLSGHYIKEIKGLAGLESLKRLDLSNNHISEIKNLDGLQNLEVLNLNSNYLIEKTSNSIRIRGEKYLKILKSLQRTYFEDNNTIEDLKKIRFEMRKELEDLEEEIEQTLKKNIKKLI
jgi:hypothetical protein